MASVVVLGAGIAGLTCAWRLQQAGHQVEVLERERTPGGRMRSERRGGYVVDRGAQFIASGYREVRRFPLAILAVGLMLMSAGSFFLGLILHAMNWRFKELHNVLVRKTD